MDQLQQAFFSARNRGMIVNMIERDIQAIRQKALTTSQKQRVCSITDHYMEEVFRVQCNKPGITLSFLNKETITISEKQYQHSKHVPASKNRASRQNGAPMSAPAPAQTSTDSQKKVTFASVVAGRAPTEIYKDTSALFETVQNNRIKEASADMPDIPDFRIEMDDNQPNTAELFERAKARREIPLQSTTISDLEGGRPEDSGDSDLISTLGLVSSELPKQRQHAQPQRPILQQHVLIKDEAVQSYREIESNLVLSSLDRDWTADYKENRYNFTVTFDPSIRRQGEGRMLESIRKFNNIVRIELVKAIVPLESIDTLIYDGKNGKNEADLETNVLTLPQILVRVDEFSANNFGTDSALDNAFGVLQYDGTWKTDAAGATKGYVAMVPKFMKCQRIFHPTPLATMQKMTIRIERPDGTLVDGAADAHKIVGAIAVSGDEYIGLRLSKYVSHFRYQRGDRVIIRGFAVDTSSASGTQDQINAINSAAREMETFVNRLEGHLISDIGYTEESGFESGWNSAGYSNYVVIRSRYNDPETGSVERQYFGNNESVENALFNITGDAVSGSIINIMRQTQLVFRIITREVDSTLQIRADNTR
jgi:hypothetical protein